MLRQPFANGKTRLLCAGLCFLLVSSTLNAQFGVVTREEALASIFPESLVKAERVFLTESQVERIAVLSDSDVRSKLYVRYIATKNNIVAGRAYIDTHQVRTKNQSLLISLDSNGRIQRIDVTAFLEPPEYMAGPSWMRQFLDKPLDSELAIGRSIRSIAGATLTARAVNVAVRRVMAIDQVLTVKVEEAP
jgi:electron transport complex protein RnfG